MSTSKALHETWECYRNPKVLSMVFVGFSCYLPFLLTLSTLSFWLIESGFSKTAIGLFALVHLPHSLQLFWTPFIDRIQIPWLTRRLGQRRSWALLAQVCLIFALIGMGSTDPRINWHLTAIYGFLVALCASCQEVVLSAFIFETFDSKHYPPGIALATAGNRLSMLVSGAGALHLSVTYSWGTVYKVMAACILVGIITILLSAEPERIKTPALTKNPSSVKRFINYWQRHGFKPPHVLIWFYHSILAPILDFKRHKNWMWILVYISIFKLADSFVKIMDSQFYIDLGFTKQQIANATKIFGMGATIVGGVIGSFMVNSMGITRALFWSSVLHASSNLVFLVQAAMGNNIVTLYLTIAVEDLTGGMATMAFVVYLASLYTPAYRTLQNAFFWSIIGFFRSIFSASAGWVAEQMTWFDYYFLTFFLAFPAIILFKRLSKYKKLKA